MNGNILSKSECARQVYGQIIHTAADNRGERMEYGLKICPRNGGSAKTFGYDPLSAMVTNAAFDPAGNPVMNRIYSRQLAGNILGQATEQGNYSYAYDSIDQLTNVNVFGYTGPSGVATNESFAYDAMGNRITSTHDTNHWSYSANSLNQYSAIQNPQSQIQNYQHDLNGNQLVHYQELSDGSIVTNYLAWDTGNRLVSITNQQGDIANYSYDPFGRRLSKIFNGVTNYYLYADEGLVAEYDGEGNLTREYGYTPGSLWMNNLVFMKTLSAGTTNYYYALNDHLGALQKLIAANGSVVWSMAQDAFGRAVVSSNSTIICNLRFSSQYYDAEFGLDYNDQRYFDPVHGRYLSQDTTEGIGGKNLYRFVMNNPIRFIDPLGLYTLLFPPWWSDSNISRVESAFNSLYGILDHADKLINERLKLLAKQPNTCPFKWPLIQQYISALARIRSIRSDLDNDKQYIYIVNVVPGDNSGTTSGTIFGSWIIALSDLGSVQTILHEISHHYGTTDAVSPATLDSAHNFESLAIGGCCNLNVIENEAKNNYGSKDCCPLEPCSKK